MRIVIFFIIQICACLSPECFAKETPSFRVLILSEKRTTKGIHEADAKNMEKTFKSIARAVGQPIHVSTIECKNASMSKLRKWSSRIHRSDTAIVYYSGPYLENNNYAGSWPLILTGSETIPANVVANTIHSSKARLSLVFIDCYNNYLKLSGGERRYYGRPLERIKNKRLIRQVKRTWLSEKGTLTMCSNKQKDISHGVIIFNHSMGIFTEALQIALGGDLFNRPGSIKISDFPKKICSHMVLHPFTKQCRQYPLFQSTIEAVK